MGVTNVSENKSLELFTLNNLPKDIDKAVSKVRYFVIDIFSKIYAFVTILIYGPRNSWQGFLQNIEKTYKEKTKEKIRKLYEQYKSNKPKKPENEIVGYKLSSEDAVHNLNQGKKNLDRYQLFEVDLTSEEAKILKPFLEKMRNENTNAQTSNILVLLNNLLNNPNVSIEIRNLLEEKLKKIPEAEKLIEALKPKISKPQDPPESPTVVQPIPIDPPTKPNEPTPPPPKGGPIEEPGSVDGKDEPQISSTYSLKKIAIVSAAVLSLATTFGVYYYLNSTETENVDIVEEANLFDSNHSFSQAPESLFSNITNLVCDVTSNTFSNITRALPWNKGVSAFTFQEDIDTENIPSQIWDFFFSKADSMTQDATFIPSVLQNIL